MSPCLARTDLFKKFPPTVICVGDVDPLIDDSTYLFNQLQSVSLKKKKNNNINNIINLLILKRLVYMQS